MEDFEFGNGGTYHHPNSVGGGDHLAGDGFIDGNDIGGNHAFGSTSGV